MNQGRNQQLQHMKNNKSKSFAHKFNEHNMEINRSNVKLLVKLDNIKPFTHYNPSKSTDRIVREQRSTSLNPATKKKIIQTERENSRIYNKMRNVSSTLGPKQMQNDYARAQKIRDRIGKYMRQDNRVELKYLFPYSDLKNTSTAKV